MSVESELARLGQRQELMIAALRAHGETVATTNAMLAELMEWLQKPPSTDLRDALATLARAVDEGTGATEVLARQIAAMPAKVARAVTTGEV